MLLSLEQDAFPALGARPVNEIEAPGILDRVRAIERRGALETAARVMQRCGAVFRYGNHAASTRSTNQYVPATMIEAVPRYTTR